MNLFSNASPVDREFPGVRPSVPFVSQEGGAALPTPAPLPSQKCGTIRKAGAATTDRCLWSLNSISGKSAIKVTSGATKVRVNIWYRGYLVAFSATDFAGEREFAVSVEPDSTLDIEIVSLGAPTWEYSVGCPEAPSGLLAPRRQFLMSGNEAQGHWEWRPVTRERSAGESLIRGNLSASEQTDSGWYEKEIPGNRVYKFSEEELERLKEDPKCFKEGRCPPNPEHFVDTTRKIPAWDIDRVKTGRKQKELSYKISFTNPVEYERVFVTD